ncbi:hypothetical protein COL940_005874 [Colletotrichum noveboracense]|nr:hypothetical protein COL940_005874 [Colletotrichum noveboracense]
MVKEFWDKHADEAIPAVTRQVGLQDAMHDSLLPGSDQGHNQWHQDSSASPGVPNREVIGSLLRELAKIKYAQNEAPMEDSIMSGQEGFAQEPFELNSWPEDVIDDQDLSFVGFDFDVRKKE